MFWNEKSIDTLENNLRALSRTGAVSNRLGSWGGKDKFGSVVALVYMERKNNRTIHMERKNSRTNNNPLLEIKERKENFCTKNCT